MRCFTCGLWLVVGIALSGVASASAQEVAMADRGPRFLLSAPAGPVPVDVGRTAVLRRRISLALRDVPLGEALAVIARESGLRLGYSRKVVPVERTVRLVAEDITVAGALSTVLFDTGVDVLFEREGHAAIVRRGVASQPAASSVVLGRVTDTASGQPLVGAEVYLKDTRWRTTSDKDGQYRLAEVEPGSYTIRARMFGYRLVERTIDMPDTSAAVQVDFALAAVPTRLDELVTTATGRQRRMEIANAVTVLRADSIVQTQPIKDVTDLLQTRVPGLAVLPTTGAPGDPSRLRLRGSRSILRSNDPIVIVDGVRIYAEQTAERNASLAWRSGGEGTEHDISGHVLPPVAAPSPLDRIDPNSIETVEVLNGPSAATLYGADAANGVIVITTKRGRPGPARWDASLNHGRSTMPGRFPDGYFVFGRMPFSDFSDCSAPVRQRAPSCIVDSIVPYQVLNDPELTVLGQGYRSEASLTVSGGRPDITYAITGSYSDEVGLLKLPQYEMDRFREVFGRAPEDWMERPNRLEKWSLTSGLKFRPTRTASIGLTMSIAGDEQGRSNLEQQLAALRGTYVDKTAGLIYPDGLTGSPTSMLVPDFYRRTINRGLTLKTGVNLEWQPFVRFVFSADAGVNADLRRDESLLPRGLRFDPNVPRDSLGFLSTGQGTVMLGTLNLMANYDVPLTWGFKFAAAIGFNYTSQSIADLSNKVADPAGGLSTAALSTQFRDDLTSYGWYVEPRLGNERLFISTGLRLDGGSNYGERVGFGGFKLPKLGFSWLISNEPFFPLKGSRWLSTLRLRALYGKAGVQPGLAGRLRLYSRETHSLDGQDASVAQLATLGNTQLRPERSSEIEWGFDAGLLDSRLSVDLRVYRQTTNDAILGASVPSSVGVGQSSVGDVVLLNVGAVRNTGFELALGTNLFQTDLINWSTDFSVSHNRNMVVSLARGLESFGVSSVHENNQRIAVGYPLNGYWERPILGYADANQDGILQPGEVLISDSLAFLGAPEPDYVMGLHTTVGLFRGALTVSASFDYQDGLAQQNEAPGGVLARAAADPAAPIALQALVAGLGGTPPLQTRYALFESVSALRFHSLSVGWRLPTTLVRWIGAQRGSLGLQGANLGLVTKYRGKDPLVNSVAASNVVRDGGALPQARDWRVRLSLSY